MAAKTKVNATEDTLITTLLPLLYEKLALILYHRQLSSIDLRPTGHYTSLKKLVLWPFSEGAHLHSTLPNYLETALDYKLLWKKTTYRGNDTKGNLCVNGVQEDCSEKLGM